MRETKAKNLKGHQRTQPEERHLYDKNPVSNKIPTAEVMLKL